jgi:hypothetical protein
MKNLELLAVVLLLTSCTLSFNLTAEIYTWTDKSGKVHFSDKPIDDEKVRVMQPKENNSVSDAVNKDSQWQQDYNDSKKTKAKQAQKNAETNQKNKRYCNNLKRQLAKINLGGRIYTMSPEGERTFQSDEQLQTEKKKVTKDYKKTCR